MIGDFKHKGLRLLYERGDPRKIKGDLVGRLQRILLVLQRARSLEDIDHPGFRLHQLHGDLQGYWSIRVSGNWRLIFKWQDGAAINIDLVDYH